MITPEQEKHNRRLNRAAKELKENMVWRECMKAGAEMIQEMKNHFFAQAFTAQQEAEAKAKIKYFEEYHSWIINKVNTTIQNTQPMETDA